MDIDNAARIIWNYHNKEDTLTPCRWAVVLGSHDLRVADHAAALYKQGLAEKILFCGGVAHTAATDLLKTTFQGSEAETFAARAQELGVPKEAIILENKSTNTGENIQFAQKIFEELAENPLQLIVVQKPYMLRRAFATAKVYWPHKTLLCTSFSSSVDRYPHEEISKEDLINIMVGDLQRIIEYPQKGFQIPQEVPPQVLEAFEFLKAQGFTKHLIKE